MKPERFAIAYVLGAILTFGYSSNAEYPYYAPEESRGAGAAINGFICSIVWPLYVSHKMFGWVR